MMQVKQIFLSILSFIFLPDAVLALGHDNNVVTQPGKNYFTRSAPGKSIPLYISSNDFTGMIRAFKDLQSDISKVTGNQPSLINRLAITQKEIVIAGTIGKSEIIDRLIKNKKIDLTAIEGIPEV